MDALKRSLAQESGETVRKPKRKAAGDRRQRNLLLPMTGKGKDDAAAKKRVVPEASSKTRREA